MMCLGVFSRGSELGWISSQSFSERKHGGVEEMVSDVKRLRSCEFKT